MALKTADGVPYAMWEDHRIQVELNPSSEKKYLEKAERELRETPENVAAGLQKLRELIKDDKDLNVPADDDQFLIKFLRPCKFYADSAFKKMQQHYKFRANHTQDFCRDLLPSMVRVPFQHSVISVLAPRDQHGRRVLLIESGSRWNHNEVPLLEAFRALQVAVEVLLLEPETQVHGIVLIFDMKGLSLAQVMQFTPSFAKMTTDWIQDCLPGRMKGFHVVFQPFIFNMVFQVFKPFLREKLRNRIHFHGSSTSSLMKHLDASCLRRRHGGTLPEQEMPGDMEWNILSHYEDKSKELASYGYKKQ